MNTIKEQLRQLYLGKWSALKENMRTKDLEFKTSSFPHLLSVTSDFEKSWDEAVIKIMIFGISTNGWNDDKKDDIYLTSNEDAIKRLMNLYDEFYHKGKNWEYGQVFWNYVYTIGELLHLRLNKSISIVWNNIYKIDKSVHDLEITSFDVIQK